MLLPGTQRATLLRLVGDFDCCFRERVSFATVGMQSPSKSLASQSGGGAAGSRVLHFGLAGTRGDEAPALVDYILVAEFDIDSGR